MESSAPSRKCGNKRAWRDFSREQFRMHCELHRGPPSPFWFMRVYSIFYGTRDFLVKVMLPCLFWLPPSISGEWWGLMDCISFLTRTLTIHKFFEVKGNTLQPLWVQVWSCQKQWGDWPSYSVRFIVARARHRDPIRNDIWWIVYASHEPIAFDEDGCVLPSYFSSAP